MEAKRKVSMTARMEENRAMPIRARLEVERDVDGTVRMTKKGLKGPGPEWRG
jgi:hypothetical protein